MTISREDKEQIEIATRQAAAKQSNEEVYRGIEAMEYMIKVLEKVVKERDTNE